MAIPGSNFILLIDSAAGTTGDELMSAFGGLLKVVSILCAVHWYKTPTAASSIVM
jgi:hypothetical protein